MFKTSHFYKVYFLSFDVENILAAIFDFRHFEFDHLIAIFAVLTNTDYKS